MHKQQNHNVPKQWISITLMKSKAGRLPAHRQTLEGLGLKRIRQTVVREDNPCIRGMINSVSYLVNVEPCNL